MFWIALELNSSKMGMITRLYSPVEKLAALKVDGVGKSFDTGCSFTHFRRFPSNIKIKYFSFSFYFYYF